MKIVLYPHPALRHPAKPVTTIDKDLHLAIGRMKELMYEARGPRPGRAAGRAAVQLLVVNITGDPDQPESEMVVLNPRILERKGIQDGEEGCLSFPGLYQNVRRAKTVKFQAYDLKGKLVERTVSDLESRVLAARDRPPRRHALHRHDGPDRQARGPVVAEEVREGVPHGPGQGRDPGRRRI